MGFGLHNNKEREMLDKQISCRRISEAMVRQIFPDVTIEEREKIADEVFSCGNTYPEIWR